MSQTLRTKLIRQYESQPTGPITNQFVWALIIEVCELRDALETAKQIIEDEFPVDDDGAPSGWLIPRKTLAQSNARLKSIGIEVGE